MAMNFRITVELPAKDNGTYTIEGWEALRRHLESLEAQGKRWIVTKA